MTFERTFGCGVYTDISPHYPLTAAPADFWRTIRLDYADGGVTLLVYAGEPDDPEEIPTLMRRLAGRAAASGYTVTVLEGTP